MYIVNQDGDQAIELHSVRYSCYWSNVYNEIRKNVEETYVYGKAFCPYKMNPYQIIEIVDAKCDSWKQDHPYEEIVDIYVDEDQKFGTFYSRKRGIEEYENILKALEDGVVVYRIPEINESERENGR